MIYHSKFLFWSLCIALNFAVLSLSLPFASSSFFSNSMTACIL